MTPNLSPASCDLFDLPCYQFAQLKKYAPEAIPQIKVDYKVGKWHYDKKFLGFRDWWRPPLDRLGNRYLRHNDEGRDKLRKAAGRCK